MPDRRGPDIEWLVVKCFAIRSRHCRLLNVCQNAYCPVIYYSIVA